MSDPNAGGRSSEEAYIDRPVSEILAEMTGRPSAEFQPDGYEYPHPDKLESVPEEQR